MQLNMKKLDSLKSTILSKCVSGYYDTYTQRSNSWMSVRR